MNTDHRMHLAVSSVALAALLPMGGCSSMSERQRGTATGAGVGAVAGAVVSSATGDKAGTGAVVGGALSGPASSMQISGRGEREPVVDNGTDSGQARNRRVEICLRAPAARFSGGTAEGGRLATANVHRSQAHQACRHQTV